MINPFKNNRQPLSTDPMTSSEGRRVIASFASGPSAARKLPCLSPDEASRVEDGNFEQLERRVEVAVTQDEQGRRQVLLQDLSYGPGVGWYVQRTIRLDPEQVDALVRSLCCARQPCALGALGSSGDRSKNEGATSGDPQILTLTRYLSRPASSDESSTQKP